MSTTTAPALQIGHIDLDVPVVLAPMAGVTNAPFRTLCRRFGAGLYVSEMITARAVVERNDRTWKLAAFAPEETPRSLQLYSTNPSTTAEAVRILIGELGIDHLDLNFGCPAAKVTRKGGGAALPWRHRLLRRIVAAAVAVAEPHGVPVTVKFRKGIDDHHLTHVATGQIAEEEGAAAVALHARTAEQHYAGAADWDAIGELKAAIASIPVLGNGDIWEAADAQAMMTATGCDGVVVGRGCLGRPWLFGQLAAVLAGRPEPAPPALGGVADLMVEHAQLLAAWKDDLWGVGRDIREFRKHAHWYVKGWPVGNDVRRAVMQVSTLDDLVEIVSRLDRSMQFPDSARRVARGHTSGPRPVALPEGWLDDPDDPAAPLGAEEMVSGG
ncbi:MAG TPA: tRNA dihydrouridine synthase DusB [Acidimicrobiales bacterium]|nr:tRNA dihydrouridine synthase DusB [Acidimicrobiales bacterium]